jgi:L-threonylcarbamoyladenylate synthase
MKTIVIKVKKSNKGKIIKIAVDMLRNNGIIIYPTETLYGIGVDTTNKRLVKRVFKIKRRKDKKFISAVSDIKMARKFFKVDKDIERLAKKFMPGPLTIIDENSNAFRIPKDKIALSIIKKFDKPITTTSANISGKKQENIGSIIKEFSGKVNLIIDDSNRKGVPSTVFDIRTRKILRKGPIIKKEIMKVLK